MVARSVLLLLALSLIVSADPNCTIENCPCKLKDAGLIDRITYSLKTPDKAEVRKLAPDFKAEAWVKDDFKELKLSDYLGKYVVLFFYPLDFTFVCPTEIIAFNDLAEQFRAINTEVLAVSVDSKFSHREYTLKSRKDGGLGPTTIPLISDLNHSISEKYGVYLDHTDDKGVSLRGTFVIDEKGIVRHISINDLNVGRNPEETLRIVKALKHSDENGVVCPAKWNEGDKAMIPNPTQSKEYFKDL